ncbi:hypothetical protein L6164_026256 [Bauhinia variegata]|uniref:Uncharacterized protein n=1 Tax=Bauhinia variegata TaxID=167791 RepID=A0ACB9LR34_BAUVA|nr:hypothetical protein L6164_026256 [Bauhinia variegata]
MSALLFLLFLVLSFQLSSSSIATLTEGSSLSVENPEDVLVSPRGIFSAGFHAVGENAYCFAIWFTQSPGQNRTLVWMANRDNPVNGKRSRLSLQRTGNLLLTDAAQLDVWTTDTASGSSVDLLLYDTGNLVLREVEGSILWQSFDFPTNTLLPEQVLTRFTKVISSRSETNHSSGFYQLFFDDDNLLHLLYNGPQISSVYWPDPWLVSWNAGRSTYNSSRLAVLNVLGNFSSSDDFTFMTSDYGQKLQRRLVVDDDGNIRVYSRKGVGDQWSVSWQSNLTPCTVHGICGPNSTCSYSPDSGRTCSCLPGYRMKNYSDWAYGCEPEFDLSCNRSESRFLTLNHVEFYGYDYGFFPNYTFNQCKEFCLQLCNCIAFQYYFFISSGSFNCYPKLQLFNGYRSPNFPGALYLRLPNSSSFSDVESIAKYSLACSTSSRAVLLHRTYSKDSVNGSVKFMLWFASGIGGLEILCILLVWFFLYRNKWQSRVDTQDYVPAASRFRKFSYSELKKATKGFNQEIGRGAGGIVYKGELSDHGAVAIKRLHEANQGEAEFLAEVTTIGKLHHMNLIEMWGYCAEGKHKLLVYEYMEHGSLAENILSNNLDWTKRFDIGLGTAKGLAYIHEECLEWILHCDVKPQNILLDSNYQPKVADFGLAKLLDRNAVKLSNFSRIRGTRGYMAPEWVFNLPITSKVDVYSYGVVVLEMITGKRATMDDRIMEEVDTQHRRLVTWVREKQKKGSAMTSWVEDILDPAIEGNYDVAKMEMLARVALQCVQEEKDERPTMNEVVEMLQKSNQENNDE